MTPPIPLHQRLSKERKKFLLDLFVTALEGGIDYWSEVNTYRWSTDKDENGARIDGWRDDLDHFHAVIRPPEHEGHWGVFDTHDSRPLCIDLETMDRGVHLFRRVCHGELTPQGEEIPERDRRELPNHHYWRQWLVADATNGEDGDYDADVANLIVQLGLFGQGVY